MKRSEVVSIIENIIETELIDYPNSFPGNKTVAEIVLTELEKAGMLPPGYAKPIPICQDGKYYPLIPGDFKINGVWCTPGQNEWEPENE